MISAIVLAAGESKRMGQPKMLMPWGSSTILEQVIRAVREGGADDILVVTGARRSEIEALCRRQRVKSAHNLNFSENEMLGSLQTGLRALPGTAEAALVTLGDQPQIETGTVRAVIAEWQKTKRQLIVPSYEKHRGHPWVVGRSLWDEVLKMKAPESPREFLNRHSAEIHYIEVNSSSILQDVDTPEDYSKSQPQDPQSNL